MGFSQTSTLSQTKQHRKSMKDKDYECTALCDWTFSVSLHEDESSNADKANILPTTVPQHVIQQFREDGFVALDRVLSNETVDALNERLEEIIRGRYDRGKAPDKAPRLLKTEYSCRRRQPESISATIPNQSSSDTSGSGSVNLQRRNNKKNARKPLAQGPLGFSGNLQNVKVLQIINVHKSDHLFRRLACDPLLGCVVAQLAGWFGGTRLAQDQIWAKPPRAAPLAFHRDSPYFMFTPDHVVTVWVALDDMTEEIGPLEYVRGSHEWGDGRAGSANQFFQANGGMKLLRSAAIRAGALLNEQEGEQVGDDSDAATARGENSHAVSHEVAVRQSLDIVSMACLKAGSISIHDGRTWHGSGRNQSNTKPRRGLGLHFVPAEVRFTPEAAKSRLWRPYVENVQCDVEKLELCNDDFPITWQPAE